MITPERKKRLGLTEHSYFLHLPLSKIPGYEKGVWTHVDFVKHAAELGAGGVQLSTNGWDEAKAQAIRAITDPAGMWIEAQTKLPVDAADVARFRRELELFKGAGGRIARVVLHGGRRYEEFKEHAPFAAWLKAAHARLKLAEPVARKLGVVLAIENHKDATVPELVGLLKRIASPAVKICFDTGNSFALCEDPAMVLESLVPHAVSVHLKDMAVKSDPRGFLLSEVPLGAGVVDLPALVDRLQKQNPAIEFGLEMITRDPLVIPCLDATYWATQPDAPASQLARALAFVRKNEGRAALPSVTGLTTQAGLALEEDHVRKSLAYARERLGI